MTKDNNKDDVRAYPPGKLTEAMVFSPSKGLCGEQKVTIEGDILSSVLHDHSTGQLHIIQQYDLSGLKL